MTSIVPTEDFNSLLTMPSAETSKVTAQMTAILSEMTEEKGNIDSLVTMLEKQPWYKKCLNTILGKNKATVAEIQQHKDKLASYTSSALAMLYQNNRIEQQQIVFLGEAVNSINGQLAATNYELLKTQAAVAELKTELVQSITGLANALNEKITSVDNFHMLITEIEQNSYDSDNIIGTLFSIIAQIDRRMASDDRKMNILQNALTKKEYLNDNELLLVDYMKMIAALPEGVAGTVYYEFFCLTGNDYANMFVTLMNSYNFLPKMEKKSKNVQMIIDNILVAHQIETDTAFSTNEIYEYFIEGKKDYLLSIKEAKVIETTAEVETVQSEKDIKLSDSASKEIVINDSLSPSEKETNSSSLSFPNLLNNRESFSGIKLADSHELFETRVFSYKSEDKKEFLESIEKIQAIINRKFSFYSWTAVWIVNAKEGVNSSNKLFKSGLFEDVIVFITNCESLEDETLLDIVEMDCRDFLDNMGFQGDRAPVIRGSTRVLLDTDSDDINEPAYACLRTFIDEYENLV